MSSNIQLLIKELLTTEANTNNSILSYREDISDEYVFFIVNEAVIDTTLRMMWFLVYKPTMKIVDSGRYRMPHCTVLTQLNVSGFIADKHRELRDRAMATLEVEKWLTEE
jgi:hypothetical protein